MNVSLLDTNQLNPNNTTSTVIQVLMLVASGLLTLAGFLLIYHYAIEGNIIYLKYY